MLDTWLGTKPAVVLLYDNALTGESWIDTVVGTQMTKIWDQGHVPMLAWKPERPPGERTPENIERRIADGAFDDTIEAWAERLASWVRGGSGFRRRFYFLLAHEMNGDWYHWSAVDTDPGTTTKTGRTTKTGTPADYVAMWRRIYDIFSETTLDEHTIQWIWTVNTDETGGVRTERYYPGDEYVDWIGLDGYNYGDINPESRWQTPEERFGPMVERMKALADKPLALTEVATTSYVNGAFRPHRKANWIDRLFAFAAKAGLKMVCWYNYDDTGTWESDWAVFRGIHGTSTVRIHGETYRAYETFKTHLKMPSTLNARTDYPRLLTDGEFAGRF